MNEAQGISAFLNAAGVTGALILFIIGLRLRWWYLASHVELLEKQAAEQRAEFDKQIERERQERAESEAELRRQRDRWEGMALRNTDLVEQTVTLAKDKAG